MPFGHTHRSDIARRRRSRHNTAATAGDHIFHWRPACASSGATKEAQCPQPKTLSRLTKFLLAKDIGLLIVSRVTKHYPDLSLLFHALADPTRRAILTRLAEGPARVTDLAEPTGLRLPTVMRHLSVLEEAGLIATTKDGRVRTCAIVPEALAPARSWLDEQRAIWEARLDRLDSYVTKLMKERDK
jgi:DNA-binding transcriptional ArsR family regulator